MAGSRQDSLLRCPFFTVNLSLGHLSAWNPMSSEIVVSNWLSELRGGEPEAMEKLWEKFFTRLVEVAGRQIRSISRPTSDGEDVASSVFKSLWRGAKAGRFREVKSMDEVWWILAAMAQRKCIDHARRQKSFKRGGNLTRVAIDGSSSGWLESLASREPDQLLVALEDEFEHLMKLLDDDRLRTIVNLRIEGFTVPEIASALDLSVPTVERKLRYVREVWKNELCHAPED